MAGFEIIPNVVTPPEARALLDALEPAALHRSRAGARHLMSRRAVADFADSARMVAIARRFVGDGAVPFRATLFDKSVRSNWLVAWHQDTALPLERQRDTPGWGPWSTKGGITYAHAPGEALRRVIALRFHFDDSKADNGPLRVLPGTHERGVLTDAEIVPLSRDIAPIDCLVGAGGVIAMRPLAVHASSKAESAHPRRVLHIEYAESLDICDGLRLARA
jgi:phytanoyl-CoA dioxygenase PhyH